MNRLVWIPVVLMVAACGTQHAAASPPASAVVTGTVVTGPIAPVERVGVPNTRPVRGVLVEARAGTTVSASSRTDAAGHYQLTVPPGSYVILVTARGYLSRQQSENVTVAAGQKLKIDFTIDTGIR